MIYLAHGTAETEQKCTNNEFNNHWQSYDI